VHAACTMQGGGGHIHDSDARRETDSILAAACWREEEVVHLRMCLRAAEAAGPNLRAARAVCGDERAREWKRRARRRGRGASASPPACPLQSAVPAERGAEVTRCVE